MKLAIVGEEDLRIRNLEAYVPYNTDEIVSTGEDIWEDVVDFSKKHGFKMTVFFEPVYYTNGSRIIRNVMITAYADELLAFYRDNSSKTQQIIECFNRNKKRVRMIKI